MVGVGGKRACTLGMQSLYWGFISFHISLSHAHSIEFEGGLSAGCGRVCNADKGLCRAQSLRGVRMDAVRGIEGKGNRNLLS